MSGTRGRVIVSGPFGGANLGDDAIASVILKELESRGFEVVLAVIDVDKAKATFETVEIAERFNLRRLKFSMIRVLKRSDALIVGGGEQISETRIPNPLWGHLATNLHLCILAHLYHRKAALLGVGVSPSLSATGRFLMRRVFSKLAYLSVRDKSSLVRMGEILDGMSDVRLGADPAFLMDVVSRRQGEAWLQSFAGIPEGRRRVLFVLSNDKFHELTYLDIINSAIRELNGNNVEIYYAISDLQADYDVRLYSENRLFVSSHSRWILPGLGGLDGLCHAIAGVDCVVSTRMHPIIFSLLHRTPFVCIARSAKMQALMAEVGSTFLEIHAITHEDIVNSVLECLQCSADEYFKPMNEAISILKSRAKAQFDDVAGRLGAPKDGAS